MFTIETSVRTPMEAVYALTGLEKDIIEVYPSQYDVRYFKERMMKFSNISGEVTDAHLPKMNPLKLVEMKKKLLSKINAIPPYYVQYPGRDKSVAHKTSILNPKYPKQK